MVPCDRPTTRDIVSIDWRTGRGYPGEQATPAVFAWEFLRRSPAYGMAWAQQGHDAAARYGIEALCNPACSIPPRFVGTCADVLHAWGTPTPTDDPQLLWVAFDPRLPTREQLVSVRVIASEQLAAWHRNHRAKPAMRALPPRRVIHALRIYDGRAAGATMPTIVDAVLIEEGDRYRGLVNSTFFEVRRHEARRLLAFAQRTVDGGYRGIALRETYRHVSARSGISRTVVGANLCSPDHGRMFR